MKVRRWFTCALVLLLTLMLSSAQAGGAFALDEIGLRYTPSEGEQCLTRTDMPAAALAALGADATALTAAMEGDGQYLICLMPDGRQFSLTVGDKPDGIAADNAWAMTAAEKDHFLTALARKGGYGMATWQSSGYALFTAEAPSDSAATLRYTGISLATLYLGRVYTLRTDIIGREPAQSDTDLLLAAADRLLLLGARTQTAGDETAAQPNQTALALPDVTVAANPAEITHVRDGLSLTLDPVPDTVGVTQLVLSGTTVPGGYLRYAVGDTTSSRVKADETGAFRFTLTGLTGDAANLIELTAFKGDVKTILRFTVTVDWQSVPFALETVQTAEGRNVTLRGLTLPGATVKITAGRGGAATVGEDGAFTISLTLPRIGRNDFTLQAQAEGYHRTDFSFSVTRLQSADESLAALQKTARQIDYAKLAARPAAYKGRVLALAGVAGSLCFTNGQACYTLTTDGGEMYTVLCSDLLAVSDGARVQLLGTLTGETYGEGGYPSLTLAAYEP